MAFSAAEISPGDVLLFHGQGFVSWAIRKIDGSDVNHAAIVLPGGVLAEAGGFGLQQRPVPQTMGHGESMRVFRLEASDDLAPVLATASAYLAKGHLYAYQQIVMLALLCVTRNIPLPRLARRMVRSVLEHAATAVLELLPVGAKWLICSEYVYRCFDDAVEGESDPYRLLISGVSFGPGAPTLVDWALDNVHDIPVTPTVTFGPMPAEPAQRVADIEASLAPAIADYAAELHAAGLADDDLPPMLDVSFGPPAALPPEPSDDELLASMAIFAEAWGRATGTVPAGPVEPTFGPGTVATISAAALKGALEGLKQISVDPNFVTPRDLLQTPSLRPIGRIG